MDLKINFFGLPKRCVFMPKIHHFWKSQTRHRHEITTFSSPKNKSFSILKTPHFRKSKPGTGMKSQISASKIKNRPEKKFKIQNRAGKEIENFDQIWSKIDQKRPKSAHFEPNLVQNRWFSINFGPFHRNRLDFFETGSFSIEIFRTSSLLELVPRSRKLSLVPARSQNECFARSHTSFIDESARSLRKAGLRCAFLARVHTLRRFLYLLALARERCSASLALAGLKTGTGRYISLPELYLSARARRALQRRASRARINTLR